MRIDDKLNTNAGAKFRYLSNDEFQFMPYATNVLADNAQTRFGATSTYIRGYRSERRKIILQDVWVLSFCC